MPRQPKSRRAEKGRRLSPHFSRDPAEQIGPPSVRTGTGDATVAKVKAGTKAKRRSRVLKGEDFEVQHLAETTDLSPNQARELLRRHGDDWRKIDEAAKIFKAES